MNYNVYVNSIIDEKYPNIYLLGYGAVFVSDTGNGVGQAEFISSDARMTMSDRLSLEFLILKELQPVMQVCRIASCQLEMDSVTIWHEFLNLENWLNGEFHNNSIIRECRDDIKMYQERYPITISYCESCKTATGTNVGYLTLAKAFAKRSINDRIDTAIWLPYHKFELEEIEHETEIL